MPDGVKVDDPLNQLQDIHLPADIGLWPPAWGWWLLTAILLAAITVFIFWVRRTKARNAYRRIAIAELEQAHANFTEEQNSEYLQHVSVILRRTSLSGFGKHFNASLKGEAWLQWLDEQCPSLQQQFELGVGRAFLLGPYQKSPVFDRNALHKLTLCWIQEHRNQWQKTPQKHQKSEDKQHV